MALGWRQGQQPQQQWSGARVGAGVDQAVYDAGLRAFMLNVYNYMAAGLVITGLVAFLTAQSNELMYALFRTPLKWVVMLAPLGFVFFLGFRIQRMSVTAAQATFWAFAGVMGLSMAAIFKVFTGASIASTFFITATMFLGCSLYGYTTKKSLSGMGGFMTMGLIGLVVASLVNIFLQSSMMQFVISIIGVVVFAGLTMWDTQRLKEEYAEGYGHETLGKMAIMGALTLYLNFINMFQMLLSLLGDRE